MKLKRMIATSGVALACSICLALGVGFMSLAKEDASETTMAATTYLNVRDTAGTNGEILGVLSPKESVPVTGITNGWYHVTYKGQAAYAYQQYLNFEGSEADGDVPNGKETDMISTVYLNVRKEATTNSQVLDVLAPQQKVQVTGKADGWYKVKHNNQAGYVYAYYLDFIKSDGGFEQKTMTANAGVNFRQGPSTDTAIIGSFAKGTSMTVVGAEGEWSKVSHNGTVGYVYTQYLADGKVDYSKEGKEMTVTAKAGLNLRTNSSTTARVMSVIPNGSKVKVLDYENGWYRVDYKGDAGCVSAEYLK